MHLYEGEYGLLVLTILGEGGRGGEGSLLGSTSLYLFFSSAPGGTSAMVTMLEGMVYVKVYTEW